MRLAVSAGFSCFRLRQSEYLADLNPILLSWFGYFKYANTSELSGIDGGIQMTFRFKKTSRNSLANREKAD